MRTRVVVLAGGKGKRMEKPFAKVLTPFAGKPLVVHLLEAVKASGVDPKPVIVLGFDRDRVRRELGETYAYVVQEEQLGTGHAVRCAEQELRGKSEAVLVLYGDHPFLKPETIRALVRIHEREKPAITMATVSVPDFESWRAPFHDFGRIVRDTNGRIVKVIEKKDSTPKELLIHEVSPSFFCFNATWLWENIQKVGNENSQHEYYLTDLVEIAIRFGATVALAAVDAREAIGVNTREHLELADAISRD